jgi:hypothetical protein
MDARARHEASSFVWPVDLGKTTALKVFVFSQHDVELRHKLLSQVGCCHLTSFPAKRQSADYLADGRAWTRAGRAVS